MLSPPRNAASVTGPVNPLREPTVIVNVLFSVPVEGAVTVREVGLAESLKSGPVTSTVTLAKCVMDVLLAESRI